MLGPSQEKEYYVKDSDQQSTVSGTGPVNMIRGPRISSRIKDEDDDNKEDSSCNFCALKGTLSKHCETCKDNQKHSI